MTIQAPEFREPLAVPVFDLAAHEHLEAIAKAICDLARPKTVAGGIGTGTWTATAANTLYPAVLVGPQGQNWVRNIRQVIVSVSAAARVVIGGQNISAGQVANGELIRFKAYGAGTFTFNFGEGILPGALGAGGQTQFWSDTAGVVIDIMVVHD
jgi:hypothetical protein